MLLKGEYKMFISFEGPTASGKTTMAHRLREHYESEGHNVVMIDNPLVGPRRFCEQILPIINKEKEGIVIADCLDTGSHYVIKIEGVPLKADYVFRTVKKDNPVQTIIDSETTLEELLNSINGV